ncbi:carboxypeptidase-like regulatory domain-containing protein [Reichenbachiella sp. MALMAid0571]|uniref:TonB-dependent receptor n=1 Tax=Reichenbachiella sp. MALMAid0571 TaxID=3143939 RepID=UPI0032DF2F96
MTDKKYFQKKYFLVFFLIFNLSKLYAQGGEVYGVVLDSLNNPIEGVHIKVIPSDAIVLTDSKGKFNLKLKKNHYTMEFSHVEFHSEIREINFKKYAVLRFDVQMKSRTTVLEGVEVKDEKKRETGVSGMETIDAKNIQNLPSGTGEFNKILSTLPGVVSNNELSSAYSVRGGNFDENLVYVNGIQVYRPFLVRAGRQEGLSFINPDLVSNIEFSAGGWQAKYGDKLSSVLNIDYKKPDKSTGSVNLSLLGGSVHYEGNNEDRGVSYIVGIRHKNTKYLLGSLETKGQYLPKFTDVQAYVNKKFKNNRTNLGVLVSTAHNRYLTIPEKKQTDFGTVDRSYRLTVAFDGREILKYDTYQTGINLSHVFSDNFKSYLISSVVKTNERENFEIEGGYRLCDLNNNPSSNNFDECVVIRGVGTNYNYGRNSLEASIVNVEQKNEVYINNDLLEFGVRWDQEKIDDALSEYAFIDSADFSSITENRKNEIHLNSQRLSAYVQYTTVSADSAHSFSFGTRLNYWSINEQLLVSPRLNYLYNPSGNTNYRFAFGFYQQPPFYRELRDRQGNINMDVKAQTSMHFIAGLDHYFTAWGRPFKFTAEAYHKKMENINPYDVENVRLRYFANNDTKAFAQGIDFRVNGEFIEGTQSWFSLGILNTREDIPNDGKGYIRRPTDQRINLGIFFEDHFPNDPSTKVNLNMLFGSGLPFGPPGRDDLRNAFPGDEYYRVDIGFSKSINIHSSAKISPNTLSFGVEILNLLGADNTISYTWIKDVENNQFAIPNSLSARFLNFRVRVNF